MRFFISYRFLSSKQTFHSYPVCIYNLFSSSPFQQGFESSLLEKHIKIDKIRSHALSGRSVDVLEKHIKIDKKSCMRVPRLKEEEAIAILLERTFVEESTLVAEDSFCCQMCTQMFLQRRRSQRSNISSIGIESFCWVKLLTTGVPNIIPYS